MSELGEAVALFGLVSLMCLGAMWYVLIKGDWWRQ